MRKCREGSNPSISAKCTIAGNRKAICDLPLMVHRNKKRKVKKKKYFLVSQGTEMFGDWDAGASHACYLDLSFLPRYWYRPALLLRTGSWQARLAILLLMWLRTRYCWILSVRVNIRRYTRTHFPCKQGHGKLPMAQRYHFPHRLCNYPVSVL